MARLNDTTTIKFEVLLGSTSAIKIQAVEEGFGSSLSKLFTVSSESGVPSQPVGKIQTQEGAFNRAVDAIRRTTTAGGFDYALGIENGMWHDETTDTDDEGWVDGACVCALPVGWSGNFQNATGNVSTDTELSPQTANNVTPIFLWSEVLSIPPVSERPFKTGPDGEWSVLKDPHVVLTGGLRPRATFLREVIEQLTLQLQIRAKRTAL